MDRDVGADLTGGPHPCAIVTTGRIDPRWMHESVEPPDLAAMRVSYDAGELRRDEVSADPLHQFQRWLVQAREAGLAEPNAMILASCDGSGEVTARTVLLKAADERGFTFFTNYTSRKARAIAEHPEVSMVFPWFAMHRQVIVVGRAQKVADSETADYFSSRPRGSQLAAWASRQSTELTGRKELEARMAALSSGGRSRLRFRCPTSGVATWCGRIRSSSGTVGCPGCTTGCATSRGIRASPGSGRRGRSGGDSAAETR